MILQDAIDRIDTYWHARRAATPCGEAAKLACLLQQLSEGGVDWQALARAIGRASVNPANAHENVVKAIRAKVPALAAYDRGRNGRDFGKPASLVPLFGGRGGDFQS